MLREAKQQLISSSNEKYKTWMVAVSSSSNLMCCNQSTELWSKLKEVFNIFQNTIKDITKLAMLKQGDLQYT